MTTRTTKKIGYRTSEGNNRRTKSKKGKERNKKEGKRGGESTVVLIFFIFSFHYILFFFFLLLSATAAGAHAEGRLVRVVDPPLETGEGADHQDAGAEALGAEVHVAHLLRDLTVGLAGVGGLAAGGHERVGGVRHDGADDAGDVAGGEGDAELRGLAIVALGLREDVLVEHADNALEEVELGHRVGDLAAPERHEGLVREAGGGVGAHGGHGGEHFGGEGALGRRLDLHLHHLERAETHIREELGRGRAREPDEALVLLGVLLTGEVRVEVFEDLVQTELEGTLGAVTNEGRQPALEQTGGAEALRARNELNALAERLVHLGAHLHVALHNIEGAHRRVGRTAGENTTADALQVVGGIVRAVGVEVAGVPLRSLSSGHLVNERKREE
ncbi:solute carrier family 25 (mitochondrial phosphate transporter), member 3 [Strigomonas culicis]|uniref:Solute carrier family 25 (Mitochondrial phosphate transporter), member 3 n=1 Tax=Strigomonas culicis TaxID=28005 RepID=S9WKZ9_9TRYP|nr:solute carrier family 25 (mitochondrial phosphate transporter), member 3 [Strigomonas culicis]|eukprot:EPY36610.1 solute carrier family 25 (mitochondrial phosphate transporter), member 3 [Strigomonas culicis]